MSPDEDDNWGKAGWVADVADEKFTQPAGVGGAQPGEREISEFTDAHLKQAMRRSMRLVALVSLAIALVLLFTLGWQSALLLLIGAAISVSSLWEWQKLMAVILAMLDQQRRPGAGRVIVGFFLRLLVAAAVLYGSLKCLHGSVFALLGGLLLAVIALSVEAGRLVRSS